MEVQKTVSNIMAKLSKNFEAYQNLSNDDKKNFSFVNEAMKQNPINDNGYHDDNKYNCHSNVSYNRQKEKYEIISYKDERSGKEWNSNFLIIKDNRGHEFSVNVNAKFFKCGIRQYKVETANKNINGTSYKIKYAKDITGHKVEKTKSLFDKNGEVIE